MKTPKNLIVVAAAITALTLAGCSEEDNPMQSRRVDFSGSWRGPFTHPAYDAGTLRLDLTEVRADSIPGTYRLVLSKVLPNGRTEVQNFGGTVENGRKNGDTGLSFTLQHSQFTWDCTGASPEDARLNGTWRSRTSAGINGTFGGSRN